MEVRILRVGFFSLVLCLRLLFWPRTIIAQLVYSFGGSGFAGANGSMMIEVVVRNLAASRLAVETRQLTRENIPRSHSSYPSEHDRARLGRTIRMPSLRPQLHRLRCRLSLPVRA